MERQIRVKGPDAERFTDYVITRDATHIEPMHGKYVILCNERGGILNDPVLLRLSEDEFWFSLADSDLLFWLQGVNVGMGMDVEIDEIDVCPLQIQGPKSLALMADLVGDAIHEIPYYGLLEAEIAGCRVVVSQSGFSGEKGYEIYLRDATLHAEALWRAVLGAGKAHQLMVIAPGHQRRIPRSTPWPRRWRIPRRPPRACCAAASTPASRTTWTFRCPFGGMDAGRRFAGIPRRSASTRANSSRRSYANRNAANLGDHILQPGTVDGGVNPDDAIGTLHDFEPIRFCAPFPTCPQNRIDAAIAATTTEQLGNSTPSNGYGTPRSTTAKARLGMAIQKYGRTTGHTTGKITGINATMNVGFHDGTARFVGQIMISGGGFSGPGDSGSLIVSGGSGSNPRQPVGLLFAGSQSSTLANPIDAVLKRFDVTIDGS